MTGAGPVSRKTCPPPCTPRASRPSGGDPPHVHPSCLRLPEATSSSTHTSAPLSSNAAKISCGSLVPTIVLEAAAARFATLCAEEEGSS